MSIRDHFVLAYAEHLHSDPTLFEIELEYMGRCGTTGRERIAAVIGHISVIPPPVGFHFTIYCSLLIAIVSRQTQQRRASLALDSNHLG